MFFDTVTLQILVSEDKVQTEKMRKSYARLCAPTPDPRQDEGVSPPKPISKGVAGNASGKRLPGSKKRALRRQAAAKEREAATKGGAASVDENPASPETVEGGSTHDGPKSNVSHKAKKKKTKLSGAQKRKAKGNRILPVWRNAQRPAPKKLS